MRFGGLVAIADLSFVVYPREITALIGPNGAGKTTVFNCLTGFYRPSAGRLAMHVNGEILLLERIDGLAIARQAGVARTFQNIRLFAGMTVLENLVVAQHNVLMRASLFSMAGILGLPRYRSAERAAIERARYWLDKIGLTERAMGGGSAPVPAPSQCAGAVHRPGIAVPRRPAAGGPTRESARSSTSCCSRSRAEERHDC
jgi:branched-chain amino acid transport system ATP-binding protein